MKKVQRSLIHLHTEIKVKVKLDMAVVAFAEAKQQKRKAKLKMKQTEHDFVGKRGRVIQSDKVAIDDLGDLKRLVNEAARGAWTPNGPRRGWRPSVMILPGEDGVSQEALLEAANSAGF